MVLVGILISIHGFNSSKCSVIPDFLYRLSTSYEKLKKICVVEVLFFSTFLPMHHRIPL